MKAIAVELKWGLRFTAIALLWMFVEKYTGLHSEHIDKHAIYTNLFGIIAVAIYVFALLDKRKWLGGTMTWREGFLSGMIVSAVVVVLSPLSQWITTTLISPEYFPNVIEHAVQSGEATREEAESYFNLKSYIMQSMAGAMILGTVTSAVVAIFVRKKAS